MRTYSPIHIFHKIIFSRILFELVLETHKNLHDTKVIEPKICNYCLLIWSRRERLKRLVPNPKLYPNEDDLPTMFALDLINYQLK